MSLPGTLFWIHSGISAADLDRAGRPAAPSPGRRTGGFRAGGYPPRGGRYSGRAAFLDVTPMVTPSPQDLVFPAKTWVKAVSAHHETCVHRPIP